MSESSREDERLALLVLLKRRANGWGDIARRILAGSSALALAEEFGELSGTLFDEEDSWDRDIEAARGAISSWTDEGLHLSTVVDPDYPGVLGDVGQTPPFIFWRGTRDDRDHRGIAIVGSRRASEPSLAAASRLAEDLAAAGRVVISGLAAGIDTAAHTAALQAGGRTVASIGTGLRRTYPAPNAALQERLCTDGLVISRFWPDGPPTKFSFPMRNEVMSAWGAATCVVQADMKSGARMQARVALQQGRDLFLYRTMEAEAWARDYVDAGKARFVDSAADMLD
jgi:DNA processing protein